MQYSTHTIPSRTLMWTRTDVGKENVADLHFYFFCRLESFFCIFCVDTPEDAHHYVMLFLFLKTWWSVDTRG